MEVVVKTAGPITWADLLQMYTTCVSTSCGSNEIVSRSQVNPATIILIAILS